MNPIPCNHCGYNFMRKTLDPEAPRLCDACQLTENRRTKKTESDMTTVDILVKCPQDIYKKLEEHCMTNGVSILEYFTKKLENHFLSDHQQTPEAIDNEQINDQEPRKRGRPRK